MNNLHANNFDNLEEMDNFLETHSPPNLKKKYINWKDQSLEIKLNI